MTQKLELMNGLKDQNSAQRLLFFAACSWQAASSSSKERALGLILDLNTVAIDNPSIVHLKKNYPGINIIAKSERTFHPELEESLRSFIFACLAKPLDPDQLNFWLKSLPSANGG